ncbi:MAG: iron uptake porin [Cyanobacteria bacterium SID2]|nr:iron uptake porin [Cyanobacteria bacterium SID2]MBP0005710.1 iron uptake porin [Cyanobacteria bacterium SBC]
MNSPICQSLLAIYISFGLFPAMAVWAQEYPPLDEKILEGSTISIEPSDTALSIEDWLEQLDRYARENTRRDGTFSTARPMSRVPSVSQLADTELEAWGERDVESLRNIYECVVGYPDGTYRGDRSLSRNEFASGMSDCLNFIEDAIAIADGVTALEELQGQLTDELATLEADVDRLTFRTRNQFSTTTIVGGRVVLAAIDVFGDDLDVSTTLGERVSLNFDTSFTGRDRLRTSLKAGNIARLDRITTANGLRLNDLRVGFDTNTENELEIDLNYRFAIGDNITIRVGASGVSLNEFTDVVNPFLSSSNGAVSRFARRNPIYRIPDTEAGIGARIQLSDEFSLDVGYAAGEAGDPRNGGGLFDGNYGAIAQLTLAPIDRLTLGLTYIHAYAGEGDGIATGTGSHAAELSEIGQLELERPVVSNSYGVAVSYRLFDRAIVGGWVGYTAARAIGVGDAEVWNWAVTLTFPDLGGDGNLGGFAIGMQPRLTGTSSGLRSIGQFRDRDVGLHLEGFYRYEISDNIVVTPGVIWLTAPNHDETNADAIVVVLRTVFQF